MQLNVVLLNSLIKAINHTYDILIILVEFDMLLFAIRSFFFWGVFCLDILFLRYRLFCFFMCLCFLYLFFLFFSLLLHISFVVMYMSNSFSINLKFISLFPFTVT